jgi:hypothetical protein
MAFKIISTGWNCGDFAELTLRSVEMQDRYDFEILAVVDPDPSNQTAEIVQNWVRKHNALGDSRWSCQINDEQRFAPRNQYEGIKALEPEDEDIIVFLDLDGDQLAQPYTLQRLADYYADSTLVTYGTYQPVPDLGLCQPAEPFPDHVVRTNSYRSHILNGGKTCFNHLRTMKGKVFKAIPEEYFKWTDGSWYKAGTDYTFMMAALELAGGRYKCIMETMVIYNNANPHADNIEHPQETGRCVIDSLSKPPLNPLP